EQPEPSSRERYLRVCGEERHCPARGGCSLEIPPRVRRRAAIDGPTYRRPGNTSACAEKSHLAGIRAPFGWKYLRVCGEELLSPAIRRLSGEIPPRVRRRGQFNRRSIRQSGNTSACAEKSQPQDHR